MRTDRNFVAIERAQALGEQAHFRQAARRFGDGVGGVTRSASSVIAHPSPAFADHSAGQGLNPAARPARCDTLAANGRGPMADVFERLRQRKIVQWALAYLAAAFALIQMLDLVGQRFGWPDWIARATIVAAAVGFVITAVLAWYHGERGEQRVTASSFSSSRVCLRSAADCSGTSHGRVTRHQCRSPRLRAIRRRRR